MEKIKSMSVQDKMRMIEYIKRNYSSVKRYWTNEKVIWLEKLIDADLQNLANFDLPKH
jgi:hypothetical protein|tara:strand:+ start:345 stop:518 length:174 start_codon:yes stop_codon:yes gene_type:complete